MEIAVIGTGFIAGILGRALAGAGEAVAAGHEVGVADRQRRGDKAADVDLGARCEQHAVGVYQENLAVGEEAAIDARRIRAQDTVQGDGR